MKLSFFISLAISCFFLTVNSCAQENTSNMKTTVFLKYVFSISDAIGLFEEKFESTHFQDYQDSVFKYNDSLTCLLSKSHLGDLREVDLRKLEDSTRIKISRSGNGRLNVISWCVFESTPAPLCSNIAVFDKNKPKVLTNNGTLEAESGHNIQVDSVIQLKKKGVYAYLLLGSNRCGNLCLDYVATLYSVKNGKIFQTRNAFSDGKKFLNDVEFNYTINDKIKVEPHFKIIDDHLICPVFSSDGTRLTGKVTYKIML